MTGLIVKLIVCPVVVYLAHLILPQVNYTALYQPILTGLVLAVLAHVMELYILNKGTLWTSTAMDFLAATVIVYLSAFVFRGAVVTLGGAVITGLILAATEIPQHFWLNKTGKTKKSPD